MEDRPAKSTGWSQRTVTVSNPTDTSRPAAVYRLYDAEGALLYIGSAFSPDERCAIHQERAWWPEVARRTEEWFGHRNTAYREELKAIRVERPKYNQMGTPLYRTPDTEAVRRRKELGPLRQVLLMESQRVAQAAREEARSLGMSSAEVMRVGKLAEIEFLESTGLFAAAVKRRREALASTE